LKGFSYHVLAFHLADSRIQRLREIDGLLKQLVSQLRKSGRLWTTVDDWR